MKKRNLKRICGVLFLFCFSAAAANPYHHIRHANHSFNGPYYGSSLCQSSNFECLRVRRGDTWQRLWPNPGERDLVMRLNRINMPLCDRSWVVVPMHLGEITLNSLSPLPRSRQATGQKLVVVSLRQQAFGAYDEKGTLIHWGPISSARGFCPDTHQSCRTPIGNFQIFDKEGLDCKSHKFPLKTHGGAPMPYCMHFHGAFALHGSFDLPGYNASHGCIRLFVQDAQWLNQQFTRIGTPIIVQQ